MNLLLKISENKDDLKWMKWILVKINEGKYVIFFIYDKF